MVNVLRVNGKTIYMNLQEIAKSYDKNKRKLMTSYVVKNQNHMRNYPSYHTESLNVMYAEWHLLFPAQKQDINCSSCRQAVVKFWEVMVDEWIEEESKPKTQTKKVGTKKRKAK